MISFSNTYRSTQREIMDDLDYGGQEMLTNLEDISIMNKYFGGNDITHDGLQKLLKNHPKNIQITILDIGCGDGEMLRSCADYGSKNGYKFQFIGIDFNPHMIELAREKSKSYSNIKFQKVDVFLEDNLIPNCDIALCTLVLHHFNDEEIVTLLKSTIKKTNIGIIINDLHRSKLAFNSFKILSKILLKSKTSHHDGLVSIARGFKKHELQAISNQILDQESLIKWRWAYRYQWIMKRLNS